MILSDSLAYAAEQNPDAIIDLATLTGACVVALGYHASGAVGNDEGLLAMLQQAGDISGERIWPLPLWKEHRKDIESAVADIKNTGGRAAGTITAALFLKEFADFPWVHLDVAGTAYSETDLVMIPRGPTGVPMGTFVQFVRGRTR